MLECVEDRGGISFMVRVVPRASRTGFAGDRDGVLRVRLAAPPVDGAANDELIALLAEALRIPRRAVEIVHGHNAKSKRIRVCGTSRQAVLDLAALGLR
jgi:uncharacterized protein (TIGR00251 family)